MLRKEQHGQKRGSCYHLDTFSQLTQIFLDRASGAGYYTCLVFGAGIWRQQVHRKRRYLNIIQGDSFGTRPRKMRISQRLFIRFWKCIYDYIPCFMRSMSILVHEVPLLSEKTGVRCAISRRRIIGPIFFHETEYCSLSENLQRICGSTWWRALKRLLSAGWSHMPHLEWEHDRNRKLFWWPDYFESIMAAKISWLKSARFFSCGAP